MPKNCIRWLFVYISKQEKLQNVDVLYKVVKKRGKSVLIHTADWCKWSSFYVLHFLLTAVFMHVWQVTSEVTTTASQMLRKRCICINVVFRCDHWNQVLLLHAVRKLLVWPEFSIFPGWISIIICISYCFNWEKQSDYLNDVKWFIICWLLYYSCSHVPLGLSFMQHFLSVY